MPVAEKTPSEIARDTLKLLLTRKLAPTPANFRVVYSEVAGVADTPPFPVEPLRQLAQALPARGTIQQRCRARLDAAIAHQSWQELQEALAAWTATAAPAPPVTAAKPSSGSG